MHCCSGKWSRTVLIAAVLGVLFWAGVKRAHAQPAMPPDMSAAAATTVDNERSDASIPTKSLLGVLRDGGLLMIPIGICSFVLLVFVFERAISLRRGRVIPRPFVRRFLEQLREGQLSRDEALKLCEENRSPVAEVFAAAVRKWGRPSVEVEQAIIDAGERVTNGLRRYLRLFNGVSTISPLLGLLGTVLGMIRAFNAIVTAGAMGRPELLAGGISQALLDHGRRIDGRHSGPDRLPVFHQPSGSVDHHHRFAGTAGGRLDFGRSPGKSQRRTPGSVT